MQPNIILFAGINSANSVFGLWETDGTATGTFELTSTGQVTVPGTPAINGEAPYGLPTPDPPWSLDLKKSLARRPFFLTRMVIRSYPRAEGAADLPQQRLERACGY